MPDHRRVANTEFDVSDDDDEDATESTDFRGDFLGEEGEGFSSSDGGCRVRIRGANTQFDT